LLFIFFGTKAKKRRRTLFQPNLLFEFFPLFCEEKLQKSPLNVVCESFCIFGKTKIFGCDSERRQPRRLIHGIHYFLLALKLSAVTDFRLSSADAVMPPKGGSFGYSIALRFARINGGRSRPRREGESAEVESRNVQISDSPFFDPLSGQRKREVQYFSLNRATPSLSGSVFGIFWGGPKDTRSAGGSRAKHFSLKRSPPQWRNTPRIQKETERNKKTGRKTAGFLCFNFSEK